MDANKILARLGAVEAEQAVLSSTLIGGAAAYQRAIETGLDTEDFGRKSHALVFDAMGDLYDEGRGIDVVAVVERLRTRGDLDDVGGPAAVSQLEALVVSDSMVSVHAETVRDRAGLRRCAAAGRALIDEACEPHATAEGVRRRGIDLLQNVYTGDVAQVSDARDVLKRIFAKLENPSKARGIPWGFGRLDKWTGGALPGKLVVLAARPGMGKTAFAINVCMHLAQTGARVGFVSCEMDDEEIYARALSSLSDVSLAPDRTGFSRDEMARLQDTAGWLGDGAAFAVDDRGGQTLDTVLVSISRLAADGVDLVAIDYLQLLSMGRRNVYEGNKAAEVGEMTKALKAAARQHKITIVLLSQLNRGVESRTDKRPMMSDLRESGAIEQDADIILFLYRDEYYKKEKTPPAFLGIAELHVAKNRGGPNGRIFLRWRGDLLRFSDLTQAEVEDLRRELRNG